eukprot:137242-Amphidinium_carterae.1
MSHTPPRGKHTPQKQNPTMHKSSMAMWRVLPFALVTTCNTSPLTDDLQGMVDEVHAQVYSI